ncbi:PucR family transcriptional regulator [Streptomyces sp. HNM0575]|uniref:PucR family transcriptional regulator n=1 Tax=Streptomyces sp. HNM0575 TaxID=2716338 RepID=UPI00145D698F|nr:PucR family transcriptional regulator [Streptomyces sp. HNM0575]NLU76485.1 PucR family transcriptional regulator [Streptomyces sp. HNM0575]
MTSGVAVQELVPTTVPVPLSVLTDDAQLGLRQVAGPDGSGETPVHSVHTSEMADPLPYLLGGELLLSAGVHCPPGPDRGEHWERYVLRSVEAGAAALGFGVAPVHDEVPAQLAEACDRHGLPLVEVPRDTPFTAVARALWQAVTQRRHRALRRLSDAQQTLAAAAAGPHPVPAVLGQLAQHLDAWAVLLDRDGGELVSAGSAPPGDARAELASLTRLLHPGPSSAAGSCGELRLSVYGLGGGAGGRGARAGGGAGPGRKPLALGLCAPHRDGIDGAIAAVAVVLLALLTERRAAEAEELRSAALVRLMLGASPEEAASLLHGDGDGGPRGDGHSHGHGHARGEARGDGDALDEEDARRWIVVHGRRRGPDAGAERTAGEDAPELPPEQDPFATAALAAGLGTTLIDRADGELRALVPVLDARPDGAHPDTGEDMHVDARGDTEGDMDGDMDGSGTAPLDVEPQPGWTLGVSRPVPAAQLPRGDAEAARALRRALAERRPLVRQRAAGADDAGGLASLVAPEEARALAKGRLAPLDGSPRLVETLRMWLSLNGSWDRTAVALEVHRNTVRQRIARTGALLGQDLADPDVRMELWFALKWR